MATATSNFSVYYFSTIHVYYFSTISVYCLWPLPHLLLVCTTVVCVQFVATLTSTIRVYYLGMCSVCGHSHVYCLWPLPHLILVRTTLVLFMCTTLVLFMCTTLVLFVCTTLVVFVYTK